MHSRTGEGGGNIQVGPGDPRGHRRQDEQAGTQVGSNHLRWCSKDTTQNIQKHFLISETLYPTSPSQLELGQTLWKSRPSSRGAKRPGGDDKSKIFLKRQIKAWYSGTRCSSCSITFLINRSSSGAAHRTSTRQIFSTTWRQKGSKVFVRWNLLCDIQAVQTSCEVNFMLKMISREAWKAVSLDIARLWKTCLPSPKSCA